jgi:hypothetical protein
MAVWEYKVISSGKGGFATPALLETFLNQLGTDEWEIIEFRGQPDNPLAFSGLARRPTQRDWTLGDAAAAAAKAEAEKLRAEFEAKFKSMTSTGSAAAAAEGEPAPKGDERENDGLRRLRDTDRDSDPDAPEEDKVEDEWDKLGADDELPTFFEAMRPHMRRNQRGPGFSVGVDYLAKKWQISEDEVLGALKECGLEIPDDEDAKVTYVDYDGDLFWVNINRRGELWVNTKEKTRPVFRTVAAQKVESEEPEKAEKPEHAPEGEPHRQERQDRPERQERQERRPDERQNRHDNPRGGGGAPGGPLPEGPALLERIRPLMRRNRREPGGSGSTSFLSRALKCSEATLVQGFEALGLKASANAGEPPVFVDVGSETWFLNKDSRGGIWINSREKRAEGASADAAGSAAGDLAAAPAPSEPSSASSEAPASGNVLAAVRLLLNVETKTGGVAAPVERVSGELNKSVEDLLGALTSVGLHIPEKPREKPVFAEHAGEIFWLNRNAKGELWLNAKPSKFSDEDSGRGRRPKSKKKDAEGDAPAAGTASEPPAEAPTPTPEG